MKKNIKGFIKEIVPVVVGILIALYINNWNEDRKERKYMDTILTSIHKELTDTKVDIDEKLKIQKSFIDTVDVYIKADTLTVLDLTLQANGISIPNIRINAWKAISNSKIELLEYDILATLADIEEGKELLNIKSEN